MGPANNIVNGCQNTKNISGFDCNPKFAVLDDKHFSFGVAYAILHVTSGVTCAASGVTCVTLGVTCVTSGVTCVTSGVTCATSGVTGVTSGITCVTLGVTLGVTCVTYSDTRSFVYSFSLIPS